MFTTSAGKVKRCTSYAHAQRHRNTLTCTNVRKMNWN